MLSTGSLYCSVKKFFYLLPRLAMIDIKNPISALQTTPGSSAPWFPAQETMLPQSPSNSSYQSNRNLKSSIPFSYNLADEE